MTGAVGGVRGAVVGRALEGVLRRPLWLAAIAASAGAGVIHLAHGPAHLDELGALGAGFYLAAALQLGWAGVALAILAQSRAKSLGRGTALLAPSAIAINGAILAAWVASRVVGLPVGQAPWTPEQIGTADGITAILQGLLLVGFITALRGGTLPELPRVQRLATAATAIAMLLIAAGTAVAISPGEVGHGHAPGYEHGTTEGNAAPAEHAATDGPAASDERSESNVHAEDGGH